MKNQDSFTKTLETTADELTRGTLFAGRYEIIEELGSGGMGKVYKAYDPLRSDPRFAVLLKKIGLEK